MADWQSWAVPVGTLVLGALLQHALEGRRRKYQAKREDALRFLNERRQAYSSLLAAAQNWQLKMTRIMSLRAMVVEREGQKAAPDIHPSWRDARDELTVAVDRLHNAVSEVVLIAPAQVMSALAAIAHAIDAEDFESLVKAAEGFRTVARLDLGTPSDRGYERWTVEPLDTPLRHEPWTRRALATIFPSRSRTTMTGGEESA